MVVVSYLVMCLIYGTTFAAIKIGLDGGLPPFYMAALRFIIASLLILLYLAARRQWFRVSGRDYLEMALLGMLMTAIPYAALFWAEKQIPSGTAALLVATSPLFIGLMSKMDRRQWMGFAIAIVGIYLVVFPNIGHGSDTWTSLTAKGTIILGEAAFAYGAIRSKAFLSRGVSTLFFNAIQMLFAGTALLVASFAAERPLGTVWSTDTFTSLLYLAVIASVVATGIYYWLIRVTNALFPSTWTYVSPIIALFAGAALLHEQLTWGGATGALLVIGGVVIINRKQFAALLPHRKNARNVVEQGME